MVRPNNAPITPRKSIRKRTSTDENADPNISNRQNSTIERSNSSKIHGTNNSSKMSNSSRKHKTIKNKTKKPVKQTKPRTKQKPSIMVVGSKAFKISKKILREIRKIQMSTANLIPRLPFQRLVRETMCDVGTSMELRVQAAALEALQDAAEMYLTQFFEDSYLCALHTQRVTLRTSDMQLTRRLRGLQDIINK